METKISELQKKQLEKIYNKILEAATANTDSPTLNEGGRNLCMELNIKPEDLYVHSIEFFKKKNDPDEVV